MNIHEVTSYLNNVNLNNQKFYDIGAIKGVINDFVNKHSKNTYIHGIEPHPNNIEILNRKFKNNENITITHGAVNTYDGECYVGFETQQRVNGLLQGHVMNNNTNDLQGRNWLQGCNVKSFKLDTFCKDATIIKIDPYPRPLPKPSKNDAFTSFCIANASALPITIQFVIINATNTDNCLLISNKYAFKNKSTKITREAITVSCTIIRILCGITFLSKEIVTLERVKTKVIAIVIIIALSTKTVTARAEQTPKTCLVIGFSLLIGSENILFIN